MVTRREFIRTAALFALAPHVFAEREKEISMGQISPRVFECALMRTPMVLFRGRYSDAIAPDEHYISLEKDFSNVELVEISGYDLSGVADASVDVVYCTVVFMHLESWDRYNYILEAFRVLRPGGRIYVDNINLCSDGGWKVFETHRAFSPSDRPPHMTQNSTPQEIEMYLKRAGFDGVRVRTDDDWIRAWGIKPKEDV